MADTGSVCIVESEGNGRMCLTMPDVLISLAGIEKIIPSFRDLEVFLQLLPRSATGERMNPYNSVWTGVREGDGPQHFHVVLLDNGRTGILADPEARQTLQCIRCGACLNTCPVYRQTSGLAYGSGYSGPIGAIVTPQLVGLQHSQSLPYASSLCGACYEVCPVKINIPEVLIHLRGRVVREQKSALDPEALAMKTAAAIFASHRRFEAAQRLGRLGQRPFVSKGWVRGLPGMLGNWTRVRDLRALPPQTFREWWKERGTAIEGTMTDARDAILQRIRAGLGSPAPTPHRTTRRSHAHYIRAGQLDPEARLHLLLERLRDYDTHVVETDAASIPKTILTVLRENGQKKVIVAEGLPLQLLPAEFGFLPEREATVTDLNDCDGIVTLCTAAIAWTGTIGLTHGPGEGARRLTLLPDRHLCIVRAEQVVETVPEAIRLLGASTAPLLTLISGPSATADIEMTRIRGVHGPRSLDVVLVR